jgi:murein L,D-transpeptidase YafK
MKNARSYQSPSFNKYPSSYIYLKHSHLKLAAIGFAVLLLSIAALVYLLIRGEMKNRALIDLVAQTGQRLDAIDKSLGEKDLQKAFGELHEVKKQVAVVLKPQPQAEKPVAPVASVEAPAQKKVLPPQASVSPPDLSQEIPYPFVFAGERENALVCEKETKTLYVFRKSGGKWTLVKAYPCLTGANQQDKRKNGDLATPLGTYLFLRFIPGKNLAENYGFGAYVLNYPNFTDRREGRDGAGIWLHGHSAGKSLGDQIVNTKGCIVVSNDALKEMSQYLKPRGTAIAVVNKLSYTKAAPQEALSKELRGFIESWRRAWESRDVRKYMSHYAPEFVSADGMGYQAFKKHKERVNSGKKFIRVTTEDLMILLPQEREGKVAIARFIQKYQSSNFKTESNKILYLKKGQGGWQIIGESSF